MGRAGLRRQFQSKLQGHPARLQLARGRSAKPCARPQQPRGLCQPCPRPREPQAVAAHGAPAALAVLEGRGRCNPRTPRRQHWLRQSRWPAAAGPATSRVPLADGPMAAGRARRPNRSGRVPVPRRRHTQVPQPGHRNPATSAVRPAGRRLEPTPQRAAPVSCRGAAWAGSPRAPAPGMVVPGWLLDSRDPKR